MIDRAFPEQVGDDAAERRGRRASRRDVLGGAATLAVGGVVALAVVGLGFGRTAVAQEEDDEAADDAAAAEVGGEDESAEDAGVGGGEEASAEDTGVGGGGRGEARGGQGGGGRTAARTVTAMPSTGTGPGGDPGSRPGLVAVVGAGATAVAAFVRRPGLRPE